MHAASLFLRRFFVISSVEFAAAASVVCFLLLLLLRLLSVLLLALVCTSTGTLGLFKNWDFCFAQALGFLVCPTVGLTVLLVLLGACSFLCLRSCPCCCCHSCCGCCHRGSLVRAPCPLSLLSFRLVTGLAVLTCLRHLSLYLVSLLLFCLVTVLAAVTCCLHCHRFRYLVPVTGLPVTCYLFVAVICYRYLLPFVVVVVSPVTVLVAVTCCFAIGMYLVFV